MSANASETRRPPAVAYATLVRLPNLFTSPPDVVLGAALAAAVVGSVRPARIAGLVIASVLLYAAGTTLNDYFDAEEDARERPERPIPAGDVSCRSALALGVGLLAGGIAVALIAAGTVAGVVAGGIALAVVLYDGLLKGTAVGFLAMGASRGMNVLLGVAAGGVFPTALPAWALAVPGLVVVYIASVTYMAEGETDGSSRSAVLVAAGVVVLVALALVALLALRSPLPVRVGLALAFLAAFLVWTGRALWAAYADPVPERIGPAVGACVLGLALFDAAFAATVGPVWGIAAAVFVLPAVGLSRVFDVT